MKLKVAVLFGGKSTEHEISIISAIQAIGSMNKDKYDIIPVYMTKNNDFYVGESIGNIEEYTEHRVMTAEEVERIFGFNPAKGESPKPLTPQQMEKLIEELGIKGMTREEIIKKNLRRAMEDEWKK